MKGISKAIIRKLLIMMIAIMMIVPVAPSIYAMNSQESTTVVTTHDDSNEALSQSEEDNSSDSTDNQVADESLISTVDENDDSSSPVENETTPTNKETVKTATPRSTGSMTVRSAGLEKLPKDENGVILYNLIKDSAQVFNININQTCFGGDDIELTVTLPKYGMAFVDNLVDDLNEKNQIRSASFVKDANGYNTGIKVVIKGDLNENYLVALSTKYVPLKNAQSQSIVENGYEDSNPVFLLTKKDGTVLAKNTDYVVRPKSGNNTTITAENNEWTTATAATWVNKSPYYDSFPRNKTLHNMNTFRLTIPTAFDGETSLMEISAIRIYSPSKDLQYDSIAKDSNYDGWPTRYGPYFDGDQIVGGQRLFGSYFTTDKVAHDDNDGKGEYYIFTPKTTGTGKNAYQYAKYNTGLLSSTTENSGEDYVEDIKYYGYIKWTTKPGVEHLEADATLKASDVVVEYKVDGSNEQVSSQDSGKGFVVHTLKQQDMDNLQYKPNGDARKYVDSTTKKETSKAEVVPGASYIKQFISTFNNTDTISGTANPSVTEGTEKNSVKGEVTEVYNFPYEMQPTKWYGYCSSGSNTGKVHQVTYTILKADGTEEEKTVTVDKTVNKSYDVNIDFKEDLENAGEGSRITTIKVEWEKLTCSLSVGYKSLGSAFDFTISETDEKGQALQDDELIHVDYYASYPLQDGTTSKNIFDTKSSVKLGNYNQSDYFYYRIAPQKCPSLRTTGSNYQRYTSKQLNDKEYVIAEYLAYREPDGGSYRNYVENPVIKLDVRYGNIEGVTNTSENGTAKYSTQFLSGNMTMTKNMSGWVYEYTVYDTETKQSRNGKYKVPELDGDTELTRKTLGLNDNERFTSLQISYDGKFTFKETDFIVFNKIKSDDIYATLLKNIKVYTYSTDMSGERLDAGSNLSSSFNTVDSKGGWIFFKAITHHGGSCNVATHQNDSEAINDQSCWSEASHLVWSSRDYTVKGPNFKVNSYNQSVIQGSTANVTFNFPLGIVANTERGDNSYKAMPFEVPEAIYIELKDKEFSVDISNKQFIDSLKAHNMTADDVSVIEKDGKQWIKLSTKDSNGWWGKTRTAGIAGDYQTNNNQFTIALKSWTGARLGDHQPLGEVYYDISNLLTKYDGSEESGYVKANFVGAVGDEHGLLEDGDTTTERLWKGNMENVSILVTRNSVTGVSLLPGKNNIINGTGSVTFYPEEGKQLIGATTITAPEVELKDYTTIVQIPKKGDTVTYNYVEGGVVKTGTKTSDYTLYLTGPAKTYNNSLEQKSEIKYTYSEDGKTYVTEDKVKDFEKIRFIKTVTNIVAPYTGVETRYPLRSAFKNEVGDFTAYIGGTWSYIDGETTETGYIYPGEFKEVDYTLTGSLWWDANENGKKDDGEENASGIDVSLLSPNQLLKGDDDGDLASKTVLSTATTDENGQYTLKTCVNTKNQFVKVSTGKQRVSDMKLTKQTSTIDTITDTDEDSDFDRTTQEATLPKFTKEGLVNISGGVIHLPEITAEDLQIHVGSDATDKNALQAEATSENKEKAPTVSYKAIDNKLVKVSDDGVVQPKKTGKQIVEITATNSLGDQVSTAATVTIYANIIYDANGGEGEVPTDANNYSSDDEVTIASGDNLSKEDYEFIGWSTDQDATTAEYTADQVTTLGSVSSDVTLYAIWKEKVYPVVFVDNADVLKITKVISNKTTAPKTKEDFSFVVKPISSTSSKVTLDQMPMPSATAGKEMTVEIKGEGSLELSGLQFVAAGTYVYEISEVNTNAKNYEYDQTVYTVTYEVVKENEQLVVTRTIEDNEGNAVDDVTFTNIYSAPVVVENKPKTEEKTSEKSKVKTGDSINITAYVVLLLVSLVAFITLKKRYE